MRKETIKVDKTIWISFDDKKFYDEYSCLDYEKKSSLTKVYIVLSKHINRRIESTVPIFSIEKNAQEYIDKLTTKYHNSDRYEYEIIEEYVDFNIS